jgi:DGQHR domain-containing protein
MMNDTPISPAYYHCVSVNQPLGTFYIASIPASRILPLVSIERRGLSPDEQRNVQRSLDPKRQIEISKYVQEADATFPTSVTVSANSDFVRIIEDQSGGTLLVIGEELESRELLKCEPPVNTQNSILEIVDEGKVRCFGKISDDEKIALVIDGQHRIEGLRAAGAKHQDSPLASFEVPLAFMFDLSPELMARIFVTINANQRKVDPSLISDLFGLSSRRSPKRTCHLIASSLNSEDNGPFTQGLKMLGRRQNATEILSQGSFCKYLLKLISTTPEEDERRLQRGESLKPDSKAPLRSFFIDGHDELILRVTRNFFAAVSATYPKAWVNNPGEFLLRKTVGFASLVKLASKILPIALKHGDVSEDAFNRIFSAIKLDFPEENWAVGMFSSSDAEAAKVSERIFTLVEPKLDELLERQS